MTKTQTLASGINFKKRNRNQTLIFTLMALPGIIWLILLRYLPMFGIVLSFKDFKLYPPNPTLINNIIHSEWVSFDNFKFLFTTTDSWNMIKNTLVYNMVFIVLTLVISVSLAIMLSEVTKKFVAKAYQTAMFFPYFLSWVVVDYFLYAFISPNKGLIPVMQQSAGMIATDWYGTHAPWPFILTFAYLWKNLGYSCILYLAAITGIDSSQYEAATIDGASKWQQVFYITLPHLKTMIIILFILAAGKIFNSDFGLFYIVTRNSGPTFPTTQVIDTYVYRALMQTRNIGMSSAAGLFQNVLGFICIMTVNSIVKKVEPDSTLF